MNSKTLNPAELKIDILCNGLRLDPSLALDESARPLPGSRAGLGSGLELILPGDSREVWVNAPVKERFVAKSHYVLEPSASGHRIRDLRAGFTYPVRVAPRPAWYSARTTRGLPMSLVAALHGTCLYVIVGRRCQFWEEAERKNCLFCSTGLDPSWDEDVEITVEDVVETASAARSQSGATFVLLQSGYHGDGGLRAALPFLEALKKRVGMLVGLQFNPEQDVALYDEAISLGADHLSFALEFYNPDYFRQFVPGKAESVGRTRFFRVMEYCARRMRRGRVSGQIIAGIEPLKDTLRAVEYIGYIGAYPLACVFRPLEGTPMASQPPPCYEDMLRVFRHVYQTCRRHNLPIDVAPNINWSLSVQPEDTLYLAHDAPADRVYQRWIRTLRLLMRPYFYRQLHPF